MNKLCLLVLLFFAGCTNKNHNGHYLVVSINKDFENANVIIVDATEKMYEYFESKSIDSANNEAIQSWAAKARQVKKETTDLIVFLDELKFNLVKKSGLDTYPGNEKREDDTEAVEDIMKGQDKAAGLKNMVEKYKESILETDEWLTEIDKLISPLDPESSSVDYWKDLFKDKTTITALLILNKFENAARIIENKAVSYCYNNSFSEEESNQPEENILPDTMQTGKQAAKKTAKHPL